MKLKSCLVIFLCAVLPLLQAQDAGTPSKTPEQIAIDNQIAQLTAQAALLNAQTAAFKATDDAEKARRQSAADELSARNDAEKAKSQAEIDKLNAQKGLISAATPTVTGARSGNVTFDKDSPVSIENTVMAYQAVQGAATKVAAAAVGTETSIFIVQGTGDVVALSNLSVFEKQADLIKSRLTDLNNKKDLPGMTIPPDNGQPSSALAAIGLIGPAIGAITSLISLFKVDDKFVPRDETADLPALYGAVAAQLRVAKKASAVYYPAVMPAYLFEGASPVLNRLDDISQALDTLRTTYFARLTDKATATKLASDNADAVTNAAAAVKLETEIAAIVEKLKDSSLSPAKRKELEAAKIAKEDSIVGSVTTPAGLNGLKRRGLDLKAFLDANDKYIAVLEPVLKAGDDFLSAMLKADASATAPIEALVQAERLRRLYTLQPDIYSLQLSVQKISGTRKEHSNFFGTSLSFSGGAVVSYMQFTASPSGTTPSGVLISSGTIPVVKPFMKKVQ